MFPPKGYRQQEYPLYHQFSYNFYLSAENTLADSTIVTLLHTSELGIAPEALEVNPSNATFAEDGGPGIFNGSIVPRIMIKMTAQLGEATVETDKLKYLKFHWMPIYTSFLDNLTAEDDKTAVEVEDILELQHATDNKDTYPLFNGTSMYSGSDQPVSTLPFAETFTTYGLTTDLKLEGVNFDPNLFFQALRYYSNKGMLSKSIGPYKEITVSEHRPYTYFSNNFTNPKVKRGNPYTFCGILFHCDQTGGVHQFYDITDSTAIGHILIKLQVNFAEWNQNFDQTAY